MNKVLMIIPDAENPFFVSLATVLQRKLSFVNRFLIVLSSDNSSINELENIHLVRKEADRGEIDGLVFISTGSNIESYEAIESLIIGDGKEQTIPVVVVDREVVSPEIYKCNILCDNIQGVRLAIDHLYEMNHRNIGIITGRDGTDPAAARFQGFVDACGARELDVREDWIFQGDFTFLSGRHAASKFITLSTDNRPTALFCGNDISAAGFVQAISESGLSVPGDISIIGFDGSPISRWLTPSLTTVEQPIERIAEHTEYALFFEEPNDMGRELQRVMWVEPVLVRRRSVKRISPFEY